jgi:hypothetical protein
MLDSNSAPVDGTGTDSTHDAAVNAVLRTGAPGAIALAGIGVALVVALWFAFYLLVFVPRAGAP